MCYSGKGNDIGQWRKALIADVCQLAVHPIAGQISPLVLHEDRLGQHHPVPIATVYNTPQGLAPVFLFKSISNNIPFFHFLWAYWLLSCPWNPPASGPLHFLLPLPWTLLPHMTLWLQGSDVPPQKGYMTLSLKQSTHPYHFSPCSAPSFSILFLTLFPWIILVSLLSVSPCQASPMRARLWPILSTIMGPALDQCQEQGQDSVGIREVDQVPLSSLLHPLDAPMRLEMFRGLCQENGQPDLLGPDHLLPLSLSCFIRSHHSLRKRDRVPSRDKEELPGGDTVYQ